MRRTLLIAVLLGALGTGPAHAAPFPSQFGPEPVQCQPAGCYSTGPGIMDNTPAADVVVAPHVVRPGGNYDVTVTSNWEGTGWTLPVCGANATVCTYTAGSGGGTWQQFTVNFGTVLGPAIEEDYFGVLAPGTYVIRGQVRRVDLKHPGQYVAAENVNVYVARTDTGEVTGRLTNADGRFTVTVYAGEYRVGTVGGYCLAPASDACPMSKLVTTGPDQTVDFEERDSVEIRGRVTEGADSHGAPGIDVTTAKGSTTTLNDGRYTLRVPRSGTPLHIKAGVTGEVYRPVQGAADCQVVTDGCNVFPTQDRTIDFHRTGAPRMRWSVTDECTSPDEGCTGSRMRLELDGSLSEVAPGRTIAKYEWDVAGLKLEGKSVGLDLSSAESRQITLTTQDDQGTRTSVTRAVQECDGDSADPATGAVVTKPSIGPCFPLRMRLLGDKVGKDGVRISLIVDNDGDEPLTELTFSGGTGITLDKGQTIFRQVFGPDHDPPASLAPKGKDELIYGFRAKANGTLRVVGAVSARTPSGREMTASSVLVIRVRDVGDLGQPDETRIGGSVIARHIEQARRTAEAREGALGLDLAKSIGGRKAGVSSQEQLMAQMTGRADGSLGWLSEATTLGRGPDGKRLSATDLFEVYLATETSPEAVGRTLKGIKNAVKDAVSAPNDLLELTSAPELKFLQRIGGVLYNVPNRDAWNILGDEMRSAARDYGADKLAQGDILGIRRAFVDVATGKKTVSEGLDFIDATSAANRKATDDAIKGVYALGKRKLAGIVRRAEDDPVGLVRDSTLEMKELDGYIRATVAIDALTGKAFTEFAKVGKLGKVATRMEAAADDVIETVDDIGDVARAADLPKADPLPKLSVKDINKLDGLEAAGVGRAEAEGLEAVRATTEKKLGLVEQGKELILRFRTANKAAYARYLQGGVGRKSGLIANKTGTVVDLRLGMSQDALGLANFTRPKEPTGLAKLVRRFVPESAEEFQRRALRYAENDQFFRPGTATKTGNAKLDARVAELRQGEDLRAKTEKLRKAASASGYTETDKFGNVTRLKVSLQRTNDGRSVIMKTAEHTLNGKEVSRPGTWQGLDLDGIGVTVRDKASGIEDTLDNALKGTAHRTLTEEARKAGVPVSDHSWFPRDSLDLFGAKGAQTGYQYAFEGTRKAGQDYLRKHADRMIKTLFWEEDAAKGRVWDKLSKKGARRVGRRPAQGVRELAQEARLRREDHRGHERGHAAHEGGLRPAALTAESVAPADARPGAGARCSPGTPVLGRENDA